MTDNHHATRSHPDYEYTTSSEAPVTGRSEEPWERNVHVAAPGTHWMRVRPKPDLPTMLETVTAWNKGIGEALAMAVDRILAEHDGLYVKWRDATKEVERLRTAHFAEMAAMLSKVNLVEDVVAASKKFCAAVDRLRCANTIAEHGQFAQERQFAMQDLERVVHRLKKKTNDNTEPKG